MGDTLTNLQKLSKTIISFKLYAKDVERRNLIVLIVNNNLSALNNY